MIEGGVGARSVPHAASQLAELSRLPAEQQVEVYEVVQERAAISGEEPTAADYRAAVRAALGEEKKAKRKNGAAKRSVRQVITKALKDHYGPLVRILDEAAELNGGEGQWYRKGGEGIELLGRALEKMKEGRK